MIFCTNCGHQNDDAARICISCGALFSGQAGSTPFSVPTPKPPQAWAEPPPSTGQTPPYYSPPQSMQASPGYGLMTIGQKRDPILVLVLSLVTCGIYGIWWGYTSMTEIKNFLGRADINPALDLLLAILTCGLYGLYLCYKYPQLMLEMQDRVRLPRNDISVISLILAIVGLGVVSFFMIQTELNKIWDATKQ